MSFVPRVMALLLMGGMLLPGWAMRDCCCSRKTASTTVRPCCAKRLAATTPLKKCCAARLKSSTNPTAVQADHGLMCRCAVTAPNAVDPNSTRRTLGTPETSSWDMVTTSLPPVVYVPTVLSTLHPQPPPIRAVSSQIWLCRWLA